MDGGSGTESGAKDLGSDSVATGPAVPGLCVTVGVVVRTDSPQTYKALPGTESEGVWKELFTSKLETKRSTTNPSDQSVDDLRDLVTPESHLSPRSAGRDKKKRKQSTPTLYRV